MRFNGVVIYFVGLFITYLVLGKYYVEAPDLDNYFIKLRYIS
jgi:hypothetical protein